MKEALNPTRFERMTLWFRPFSWNQKRYRCATGPTRCVTQLPMHVRVTGTLAQFTKLISSKSMIYEKTGEKGIFSDVLGSSRSEPLAN